MTETVVSQNIGLDSLLIERATPEHVPYLRQLKLAVMRDRYQPAEDAEEFERWRLAHCTDEYFAHLIESPKSMVLCIGSLREPVGMVILNRKDDQLEIDDLLTLHARRGDGTRLLTAALRYAEAWHIKTVSIDVYPGHRGVEKFLAVHGFTQVGETSNDIGRPMHQWGRQVQS